MMPCGCDPLKHVYCKMGKELLDKATEALVPSLQNPDDTDLDEKFRAAHQAWLRHRGLGEETTP